MDRKYLLTSLRRCTQCKLLFRTPTTTEAENAMFYQDAYEEGITTDLPTDVELDRLKAENFASLSTSYCGYIEVMRALGVLPGARVLDFGCSWGYGSHQLRRSGYAPEGYEISQPRAAYARAKLGVRTLELSEIETGRYDAFLSAHVVEHVPSVEHMTALAERSLRPGGLFLVFTPNGSMSYRRVNPKGWHRSWGGVHPQLLDEVFLSQMSQQRPSLVATYPYPLEALRGWAGEPQVLSMQGHELMWAFRKSLQPTGGTA